LTRSNALPAQRIAAMNTAIANAEASHSSKDAATLKTMAASLGKEAAAAKAPADASRMRALAEIMKQGGSSVH
jgi:hypothetical protein